jgi:hypothetical protein
MMTDYVRGLELQIADLKRRLHTALQMPPDDSARYRLLRKQVGKQGETIYTERCKVAELQGLISKESRGVYRRIQDNYDALYAEHEAAQAYIDILEKKLDEAEKKTPAEVDGN